ncbi:MAG: IS701 family transposase, partial [Acidobacteria bacterium]|nr:IS701 family transposase [Acidobacteriota bacterium]
MTTDSARALLRRVGRYLDRFSACFSRQPQREAVRRYLDGLFNDSERKSMEAMHGRLSDPGQYQALQHFITHSPWDATRVWTQLRTTVPVRTGILAIDDTGFPKQGTHSVGVHRQYCGALGKIGNCQVAVSSALIADGRTWPLAWDLYLPAAWMDDPARRATVGIPPTLVFREKWRMALAQVRSVQKAGFTITGVVVDADYGSNAAFRAGLERLGLAYGVAIRGGATFAIADVPGRQTAVAIADSAPAEAWDTVTWGAGTHGPLTARFCAVCALCRRRHKANKLRNVLDHLPERQRPWVKAILQRAYRSTDGAAATRGLRDLATRLERDHPSAAASVREGLEETLTILSLGLSDALRRSLSTTNAAESLISRTRHVKRNVKRWRGGQMVLRWVAAGVLEAVTGFRRITGFREMPPLIAAPRARDQRLGR